MTNLDVTLDAIGNVTWKSDVGNFTYHATKRRAVVSAGSNSYGYDANGNMTSRNGSTINYASYNLPTSIASGANSSTLAYGAWRNTVKQVAVTSGTTETTIYVAGLLEKVTKGTTTEYRHRIDATPGTVAIYVRKSSGSNATYYLHRDHLGSPEMITNASGNSVVKLSFSAYGERRDVDWDGPITSSHLTSASNVTRHGFTDHLHLDSVKLVHMGGRVYDPVIGRFLSRDPYIDGVASSQGANGYAYVWNNPLSRWDPTGYGGTHENFAVWANFGRGERRISNGLEEFVVTGTSLDPPPLLSALTPLDAAALRLGHIGTGGTSGDGGEPGGTGAYDSPAVGPIKPEPAGVPPAETELGLLSVAGTLAAVVENVAKYDGLATASFALQRIGIGAGLGTFAVSLNNGDTKGAVVSGAFAVAQIVAVAYGSPFALAAVTVATISFTVGQVAGGL